jgi:hypothetical protein
LPEFDIDTVLGWRGNTVRGRGGEKIGTVGDVFLDRETDRPAWIGVRTGWFGAKESYVSLSAAKVAGDEIHVPYDKEVVRTAPQIDPEVALTAGEENALYRHYGEDHAAPPADGATGTDPTGGSHAPVDDGRMASGDGGAEEGDGMVRSEEEVGLGHVERRPTERVRIKKVLVTDEETRVVPVRREVVQLEHEPPPSGTIESSDEVPDRR